MANRVISNHKKNRGTGEVNEEDVGSIIEEEEKGLGGGRGVGDVWWKIRNRKEQWVGDKVRGEVGLARRGEMEKNVKVQYKSVG